MNLPAIPISALLLFAATTTAQQPAQVGLRAHSSSVAAIDGFAVPAAVIELRSAALNEVGSARLAAIRALGETAMDRVSAEMLKALVRTEEKAQRSAAAAAMIQMGERAKKRGYTAFAGSLGEHIYLSSYAVDLRDRAYSLFMLLDSERADRHRGRPMRERISSMGGIEPSAGRTARAALHRQSAAVADTLGDERLVKVSTAVLMLRAEAVAPDDVTAVRAIERLGSAAKDAVSEELLYAFYRGRGPKRRVAASRALLSMLEAADADRRAVQAARIREQLTKSTLPADRELREQAARLLWMAPNSPEASGAPQANLARSVAGRVALPAGVGPRGVEVVASVRTAVGESRHIWLTIDEHGHFGRSFEGWLESLMISAGIGFEMQTFDAADLRAATSGGGVALGVIDLRDRLTGHRMWIRSADGRPGRVRVGMWAGAPPPGVALGSRQFPPIELGSEMEWLVPHGAKSIHFLVEHPVETSTPGIGEWRGGRQHRFGPFDAQALPRELVLQNDD